MGKGLNAMSYSGFDLGKDKKTSVEKFVNLNKVCSLVHRNSKEGLFSGLINFVV